MLLLAALPGCGKRGDPIPLLRIVPQPVTELKLSQRGEQLETSFVAPRASADGSRLGVIEVELQKMAGEGDFEKLAARTTERVAPGETIAKSEPLPAPGTLVRIAARASAKGRSSSRTPIVTLLVQPPPLAPQELTAELTPTGLALRWIDPNPIPTPSPTPEATPTPLAAPKPLATPTPRETPTIQPAPTPAAPASPTPPTSPSPSPVVSPSPSASPTPTPSPTPPVRGIWIYRRAKDGVYTRPLQDDVVTTSEYEDKSVVPGEEWCYVVRFLASKLPLVESASSPEACAGFKDIAAPAVPIGVAVLLRADGVEVSWSPSPEADLAGYRVYRVAPPGEPRALVAEVPAQQTSIKDVAARAGAVNVYTVTALDKAGNESGASTPVQVRP